MPYTRIDTFLNPTHTQQTLYDFIKARFLAIGGHTLVDEYNPTTNKVMVFEVVFDTTKTYGKVYLWIQVGSSLAVQQQLYATWTPNTDSGTFPSTISSVITFVNNIAIDAISVSRTSEYKFLILSQSTTIAVLGILRPDTRPSFWSEDSYPYAFHHDGTWSAGNMLRGWNTPSLNPYANTSAFTNNMADTRLASPNSINNKRDVLTEMILYSTTQGIAGKTSAEIGTVAGSGLSRGDIIQVTSGIEEYYLVNPNYGALVLRSL